VTELHALGTTLRELGPWGLVALLCVVLRHLDRRIAERDQTIEGLQKARIDDEKARTEFALDLTKDHVRLLVEQQGMLRGVQAALEARRP
jgi:uncharacterized coiled-coil protein SlyX